MTQAAQVPAGDAFTALQRQEIAKAVADAELVSGRTFSVHVGQSQGSPREYAESLHAKLLDPAHSVLIHVDPAGRALEIVTGSVVRRSLSNGQAALAAITMQTAFATGDLTRGLMAGLQQLAPLAKPTASLHTDTP
jgi:uncharacterized membrane protein YgcG